MPKDLISDAKIRTPKPDAKPYKLSDGGGLFLLIQPSGSKLWRWKFRLNGKENLFAIGSYPEVGLADTRTARDAARDLAKQGPPSFGLQTYPCHRTQNQQDCGIG